MTIKNRTSFMDDSKVMLPSDLCLFSLSRHMKNSSFDLTKMINLSLNFSFQRKNQIIRHQINIIQTRSIRSHATKPNFTKHYRPLLLPCTIRFVHQNGCKISTYSSQIPSPIWRLTASSDVKNDPGGSCSGSLGSRGRRGLISLILERQTKVHMSILRKNVSPIS